MLQEIVDQHPRDPIWTVVVPPKAAAAAAESLAAADSAAAAAAALARSVIYSSNPLCYKK